MNFYHTNPDPRHPDAKPQGWPTGKEVLASTRCDHPAANPKSDLALRIACALMPQMATDAKNGNAVAQDGINHLASIAQLEIDQ